MINYPKVSLGESLEASRAAAAWIRESEAREIECRELGKELMNRLTPLILKNSKEERLRYDNLSMHAKK